MIENKSLIKAEAAQRHPGIARVTFIVVELHLIESQKALEQKVSCIKQRFQKLIN